MFDNNDWAEPAVIAWLRDLARGDGLAAAWRRASAGQRHRLYAAAYALAGPLVFERLTRGIEQRRGHRACMISVQRMADGCRDRFYDDMEAVVHDALTHAGPGIANLEGWIVERLRKTTVDAHRRRRGERGAVQRPRLPGWLVAALGADPWHQQLAIEVLTWVGVPATAGRSIWPLDAWAERRAAVTGDWSDSGRSRLEDDLHQVLAAMRRRPSWYAPYVERPLGTKPAPVAAVGRADGPAEPPALRLVDQHDLDDALLTALAGAALDAIAARLADDPDRTGVVVSVLAELFGRPAPARAVADTPHTTDSADEHVLALLQDPARVDRLVAVVLGILGPQQRPG